MKSVRLDADLESRLKRAADVAGVSESDLMRSAVSARVDAILGGRLDLALADAVGSIHGGGGRAREAHRRAAALVRASASASRLTKESQRRP